MSTTIKTGWLNDKNGDKFAPKTLTSQVQTSDGVLLEDKIQADLDAVKEYTDTKTSGLASTSSVNTSISTHNTSTSAHNDIRALIADLITKLNNFLDVDDTTTDQLSEVITLINNNKGTLESLTTSKINVSDIVNNLTTNSASKVLSAAQGVAIKALIDSLQTELDTHEANKANPHGVTKAQVGLDNVDNTSDANKPVSSAQQAAIDTSLEAAKSHTDSALNNYYTITQIDNFVLITLEDIDAICVIPLDPGLYQDGVMTMSWDELIDGEVFVVESGFITAVPSKDAVNGELVFSDDVSGILHYAFEGCANLTSVVFPKNLQEIFPYAFSNTGLQSVSIPLAYNGNNGGVGAFMNCKYLTSAIFDDGITTIFNNTFKNCSALSSVVIPSSVISIGVDAFSNCESLTSITFNGMVAQWNAISKPSNDVEGDTWRLNTPLAQIICSDGTITL
jgi:hypothetical protein